MPSSFDPRFTPARPDLAAAHLEKCVPAERYVEGKSFSVSVPYAPLYAHNNIAKGLLTQALLGERVLIYEEKEEWAWGQLEKDGYVGYIPLACLTPHLPLCTHRICVPSTFLYPEPSCKVRPIASLPLFAKVHVRDPSPRPDPDYAMLWNGGYVYTSHLHPLAHTHVQDPAAYAQQFLYAPYLWGGKTHAGIDCSGLVQLCLEDCPIFCPRDSDMILEKADRWEDFFQNDLLRNDIICWKGHVGILSDAHTLIHASGHHMYVIRESLDEACHRIAQKGGGPILGRWRPWQVK